MRRSSSLLTVLFSTQLLASASHAALDKGLAAKFYKTPRSPFYSGETNRRTLEKNWVRDYSDFSYLVQRENRKFWVKAASVARDLQLSQTVYSNRTQKNYKVLQTAGASILGQAATGGAPEWLPLSELTPLPQDTGVAMTLTNTQLREEASWKSDSLLNIPPASRLKVLEIEETWAKVSFESVGSITGWVDLNNLLLKADFAAFIMTKDLKWTPVLHREGADVVTADKKKISVAEITGLMTKPDLGISLVTDDSERLLLRQSLTLVKTEFQIWSMSRLNGHGDVFWKKQSTAVQDDSQNSGLTIDELLKRAVSYVSFHPKNPNMGIVSAQGVFITTDGKTWKQLPQFGNQDFPVLVDSNSYLYVGTQRSLNGGKSFAHYFRLANLAALVEKRQQAPVQQLRVKNLSSPRPGILRLEVETTKGSLALAARAGSEPVSKWDFD